MPRQVPSRCTLMLNCARLGCFLSVLSTCHASPFACSDCTPVAFNTVDPTRRPKTGYTFVVDSGATTHCINNIAMFETIYNNHPPVHIVVANGKRVLASAVGSVRIHLTDARTGRSHDFLIHNVVYSPSFSHNLLSVRRLWKDQRLKTVFGQDNYFKDVNIVVRRNV